MPRCGYPTAHINASTSEDYCEPFDKDGSEHLAREFFRRVWTPPHELDAIDELMSPTIGLRPQGPSSKGEAGSNRGLRRCRPSSIHDVANEHLEIITNAAGDRVVSRWVTRGRNNGMLGFPADQAEIEFTGIAIWRVENNRLAECWVERSAFEFDNRMLEAEAGQRS